eukprot:CAMPEP_0194369460 /NCGR_PEP_ID=MMETSP0174-20130528/17771_1 /TAXON_ID=216777 /ORGANISM="Proboscia alata, Strain PI-D3" /LENGTH=140 /DNA_ID=CAMNT_0039146421 /DNA_START=73 /DNA_END=495 /DNA_ORIENTATION=-
MTIGQFFKLRNTTAVPAKIKVKIVGMKMGQEMTNARFMVWLKRKEKARGTELRQAVGKGVVWGEDITMSSTLYRDKNTGRFKQKRYSVVVIRDSGEYFGTCEINVGTDVEEVNIPLAECKDEYARIRLAISVHLNDDDYL